MKSREKSTNNSNEMLYNPAKTPQELLDQSLCKSQKEFNFLKEYLCRRMQEEISDTIIEESLKKPLKDPLKIFFGGRNPRILFITVLICVA